MSQGTHFATMIHKVKSREKVISQEAKKWEIVLSYSDQSIYPYIHSQPFNLSQSLSSVLLWILHQMQFPLRDEGMVPQPLPPKPLQNAAAYTSGPFSSKHFKKKREGPTAQVMGYNFSHIQVIST